jgi:mono/diheme cytochrome c family protein
MRITATLLACLALSVPLSALAQDPERGRQLYENHCLACHYERIHKRDPARSLIVSVTGLQVEVARRAALTGQRLGIQDQNDIVEYLDRTHYRLRK